ncbi:MAG: ATP-binding cassette domain-containing protein [Chlamydiota bacterium]
MLLKFDQVTKIFPQKKGKAKVALQGVSFSLKEGETLAIVGKSGSGKSTIASLLMQRFLPDAGQILVQGEDLHSSSSARLFRREMQMVFQDPTGALNPHLSIQAILEEPRKILGLPRDLPYLHELLDLVHIPKSYLQKRPRECSGGELQRIAVIRSLSVQPKVLICDEVLASLDEPKKEQLVLLLQSLLQKHGLSCIFITHNLLWAKAIATRTAVLLEGKMLEIQETKELFAAPQHPYTRKLLSVGTHF